MNHTPWRFLPQDHLYSDCYNHGKSGYYRLRFRPQFALYRDCLLWLTLSKGDRLTKVYHKGTWFRFKGSKFLMCPKGNRAYSSSLFTLPNQSKQDQSDTLTKIISRSMKSTPSDLSTFPEKGCINQHVEDPSIYKRLSKYPSPPTSNPS